MEEGGDCQLVLAMSNEGTLTLDEALETAVTDSGTMVY